MKFLAPAGQLCIINPSDQTVPNWANGSLLYIVHLIEFFYQKDKSLDSRHTKPFPLCLIMVLIYNINQELLSWYDESQRIGVWVAFFKSDCNNHYGSSVPIAIFSCEIYSLIQLSMQIFLTSIITYYQITTVIIKIIDRRL